jgi:hypothetical protein
VLGLALVGNMSLLGIIFIVIAFMLKLYPGTAIAVMFNAKHFRIATFSLSIMCIWFVINIEDFVRVWRVSPSYQWNSYGLRVPAFQIAEYFKYPLSGRSGLVISTLSGAVFLLLCTAIIFSLRNLALLRESISFDLKSLSQAASSNQDQVALGSLSVFLGTFFLGMSWDTKLIFLLPFVFWGILKSRASKFLVILCYLTLFLSAPIYKPLQTIGDFATFLLVAYFLYLLYVRFKNLFERKYLSIKQLRDILLACFSRA